MQPDKFTLSQDEFNAHMLRTVMEATAAPNETESWARTRCAAIVEMFRAFDAANAMESMIACHCITLQYLLNAAMRDAGNVNLEPAALTKARASAMTISKTLHVWMTKYDAVHTRNETRTAEMAQPQPQPQPRPAAAAPPPPPREAPDQPKLPAATRPPAIPIPPLHVPAGMRDTLLASTAMLPTAASNGGIAAALP